ncbi:MAG: hypothetical protein KAT65_22605 [Methanophagales archaeon]|nr:hypothetical protein [Methanophagales archaeon]
MKNEADKQVTDFLKDAVTYLENRIAIVDNKASILIAVQGVFFALLTYIIKEVFLTTYQSSINVVSYVVLGGAFVIFILTVLLLLQTIRPSKMVFGLRVPFENMEVENYVMWFDDKFPTTPDNYSNKINTLDLSRIKENYEKVHFITLQLVRNKYGFYRWAAVGMKLLVLWSAIGITVIAFLKW